MHGEERVMTEEKIEGGSEELKAYWTHEVAKELGVSDSTLRKWCHALEGNGYRFVKGEGDARAYTGHDIEVLRYFKMLVKEKKSTKENAAIATVEKFGQGVLHGGTPPVQGEKDSVPGHSTIEVIQEMAKSIEDIKQQLNAQMEFNKRLIERMDQQNLNHLREIQETRKQLAVTKKKNWWEFWK